MERRFLAILLASAAFMPSLLLLDRDGLPVQTALGVATAAFLFLVVRRTTIAPAQVLCCILVASLGEVVLSLGWGLYSYAHAIIPLYVPPGHGLFYTLAAATAQQELFPSRARTLTRAGLAIGTLIAVVSLLFFTDVWGFLWWLGALALIRTSRNQLLLSACFAYTILLEWLGTAIGNWQWLADV